MKKTKQFNNKRTVNELAATFEEDLKKSLPITVHPSGSIAYKEYAIVKNKSGNWCLYNVKNKDLVAEFYLRTTALMAAKAYYNCKLERFHEIKRLDNRYWANFFDYQTSVKNIKTAKEFDRYMILLNKLEHSQRLTEHYKEEISRMFKWSFA
jgi:hypothetical protein